MQLYFLKLFESELVIGSNFFTNEKEAQEVYNKIKRTQK